MSFPALAVVKMRLALSSNEANRHEGTTTPYVKVVNHLLRRYATDTVAAKAEEKLCNFK